VLGSLRPTTQYGLHIGNQGIAGTTNSYGLFVDAQAGSTNSYSAIFAGGNVGIGTSNPSSLLDVAGNINTSTQFNILGSRVLSNPGSRNIFAGADAGPSNGGVANSFFGDGAGIVNTSGSFNSFVGQAAGGKSTMGDNNSFFGRAAGFVNTTGNNNTALGFAADVGANNLDHATAIGAGAVVSTNNTVALGRADGSDIVDVPGKLQIDTLATAGSTQLCLNSSSRVGPCSSSLRYKTQVQQFLGGLSILNRLRPITFTWKDGGMRDLGLGAEEVERIEPLLTFRNKQGELEGVKYNQLNVVLINAIKEQQEQIKQQQRQIEGLKWLVCRNHRNANVCK
jgi:hypothetical protein